jgi:hypothetical protein
MRKTCSYTMWLGALIEPKDWGIARGEPLMEYDKEDGKISFLGPKELFEEISTDESAMKAIRDRYSDHTASLPLQSE